MTVQAQSFSGPLPPPTALAHYEAVFPGCAERIVRMAENQSEHRQKLESSVILGNVNKERIAQHYAAGISAIAIVGGIVLIGLGKDVMGLSAILATLASLAGVFIYGRAQQKKEREAKQAKA